MRLFIQIDIGDWKQRNYNTVLGSYASSLADDLIGTDVDNESEPTVIDLVIKLVEQAGSVFVFISAAPDAALGSADKLIQHLIRHQPKTHHVVLLGEHPALEKAAQNFQGRFFKAPNTEEVKKQIHDFARKIPSPDRTSGLAP